MKKLIFTFACIFLVVFYSYAQRSEDEIAIKEYFSDAEFFLSQEFFVDALNDYLQVYKRGYEENANINYRIGICYLNIPGRKQKSIKYFEKAKTSVSSRYRESSLKEKNAPIDVYLYLGNAYRVNDRLDDAILSYNDYKNLLPDGQTNLHQYADQQIEACNIAKEFMKRPIDVEFANLGPVINDINENYKALISADESTLIYMHRLPFYDAIYFSKNVNGIWSEPENITPQILSDGNQFVSSLSYEGSMLFLSKEDEFNSDIYVSLYIDNRWTKSKALGSNINTKYWESHASISKDGKTLYFTSNRKGSIGDMDIYVSHLSEAGNWGGAKNLGTEINSKLNEDTPFITEDGKSLYFSSQGFTSMGGYDVFKSELNTDNEWSIPQNLGYPLNTTDDDLFYYPWNNGEIAYMSKILGDGYGATDIYKVIYPVVVDEKVIVDTIKPEKIIIISTVPSIQTIEISPVLFDFDKSFITESGKDVINVLVDLLKNNNDIKVELLGYTDALGPTEYNVKLAKKRAVSVMNIFLDLGIDAVRLQSTGMGEVDNISINKNQDGSDNSEGRAYNRRVEFEVLGVDKDLLIIKRINPVPTHLRMP